MGVRLRQTDINDRRSVEVCLRCPLTACVEESQEQPRLDLRSINQAEAARAIHCTKAHVNRVFLGKQIPSLPLAYDLSQYLGVTIDDLYTALTGANGSNPARYNRSGDRYIVEGHGYPNLKEALAALGAVTPGRVTHYDQLPRRIKARITRNNPPKPRGRWIE